MRLAALIFDIGGTVFDWHTSIVTALSSHECFSGIDPAEFAVACRAGFLEEVGQLAEGGAPRITSDEVFARVTSERCRELGLNPPETARFDLETAWRRMPAWPGAKPAIGALRRRYVAAPLTILSWPMAVGSSRTSGIDWDGVLSCDVLGVFKPDPRCYERAAEILGLRPDEIAMVAAHPSDLRSAMRSGYRSVYVKPRLEDPGDDYTDTGFTEEFDIVAENFEDLSRRLL